MPNSPLKELLKRGMQASLDEHQVPLHLHLKVVEALSKAIHAHKEDMNLHKVLLNRHAEQLKSAQDMTAQERQAHQEQLSNYDSKVQRLTSIEHIKGDLGEPGTDGQDGIAPTLEEIVEALKPYIPAPIPGEKGKDAQFDKDSFKKELVDYFRSEKPLDISHIKNAQSFIKNGVTYRIEELMHGGGSSTGGTGISIVGISGTINDSNVTFTASSLPKLLNINGAFYQQTGGAITWSYSVGTITLSSPVGTGGAIYGIS